LLNNEKKSLESSLAQDDAAPALMGPPKLRAPPARPEGAQTVTKSAKDIFTEWDKDANGLIDFDEFVEAMRVIMKKDKFKPEKLSAQEATFAKRKTMLSMYEKDLDSPVLDTLFKSMDADGDGKIDFKEFLVAVGLS